MNAKSQIQTWRAVLQRAYANNQLSPLLIARFRAGIARANQQN